MCECSIQVPAVLRRRRCGEWASYRLLRPWGSRQGGWEGCCSDAGRTADVFRPLLAYFTASPSTQRRRAPALLRVSALLVCRIRLGSARIQAQNRKTAEAIPLAASPTKTYSTQEN